MSPRIAIATKNAHKVDEIRSICRDMLGEKVSQLVGADEVGGMPDVVEDEVTFEGNALLKARALAAASGVVALADDSGLAVDVLGGAPGIFSARWAGGHGDDAANRRLLLAQIADVPDQHRGARFVCAVAIAHPSGEHAVVTGTMEGAITREERGDSGFGYDPIFVPRGFSATCAELTPDEKNSISHRGDALSKAQQALLDVLDG